MKTVILITIAMVMAAWPLCVRAAGRPEVLTRGPMNEAFAQPVNLTDSTGFIAPVAPPPDIEEIPSSDRPSGERFVWVSGYWAWNSDRNDYIWVSGCWRAAPPGRSWVPGYWAQTEDGWQWVAGFWASKHHPEIAYLPEPPKLTDVEAPGPPPSANDIWVPPCWHWRHGQYIWRRGYWLAARTGWVWVPSHYVWTPRGYVFVTGHWDYALDRRGLMFAPVYFPDRIYDRPGFSYTPNIVVDIDNLQFGLFARPRYSHYYFGDYYNRAYLHIGIFPWFEWTRRHTWYDPIYLHERWRHRRSERRWEARERREYERRRANPALRPPRTYREMERRLRRMPRAQRRRYEIAAPMRRIAKRKRKVFRIERMGPKTRKRFLRHARDVQRSIRERRLRESRHAGSFGRRKTMRSPSAAPRRIVPPKKRNAPARRPSKRIQSNQRRVHRVPASAVGRVRTTVPTGRKKSANSSSHKVEPRSLEKQNVPERRTHRVPASAVGQEKTIVSPGQKKSANSSSRKIEPRPTEKRKGSQFQRKETSIPMTEGQQKHEESSRH